MLQLKSKQNKKKTTRRKPKNEERAAGHSPSQQHWKKFSTTKVMRNIP